MSHFAVAVLTDRSTTVDELLAPFDENIVVEKYMRHTKEDLIRRAREDLEYVKTSKYDEYVKDPEAYLRDKCNGNPLNQHYVYLGTEFMSQYNESDEEVLARELSYYEGDMVDSDGNAYSTYNPRSKWDWYSIGGRFSGMLLDLETGTNEDELLAPEIDFLQMASEEKENLLPYTEMLANGFYNPEYLKRLYPDEKTYELINTTFWTRAVVTPDGEWHELGEMGYFAISSEEPEETLQWVRDYYDSFMKPAIENNWEVHIVDCHI